MPEGTPLSVDSGNPCVPGKGLVRYRPEPYRFVLMTDPCAYCGRAGGTLDHIKPRSAGGSNAWPNLTGACQDCNGRKASQSVLEFLVQKAQLSARRIVPRLQAHPRLPAPKVINPIVGRQTRRRRRIPVYW